MIYTERQEIPKKVKLEVFKRAGGLEGVFCEKCGLSLKGKLFEYHHARPCWMETVPVKDRPPITAADVQLLGKHCCHAPISRADQTKKAKGDRLIVKQVKAKPEKRRGRGFLTNRNGPYKKPMSGAAVPRNEGEDNAN